MVGFSRHPVAPVVGLPAYDSGAYCKQLAGSGVGSAPAIFNACQQQEQTAYRKLKAEWDQLSPRVRQYCNQVASIGTAGSYAILDACVAGGTQTSKPIPAFQSRQ